MALRRKVGKTLLKAAVVVAAVNATVCTVVVHVKKKAKEKETQNKENLEKHFEVFMHGRKITLGDENFNKIKVKTFLGGVDLDLREAVITEDITVSCKSFMGGINIRVPEGVNVVVKGNSVLGGVTNFVPLQQGDDIPTIYVNANQVMGGLCVKAGAIEVYEETDDTGEMESSETGEAPEMAESAEAAEPVESAETIIAAETAESSLDVNI